MYTLLSISKHREAYKNTSGIGEAISRYLINHGCNVVLVARSQDRLEKIKNIATDQIRVVAGDVKDCTLPSRTVELAIKEFGRLDGIVINHGVMTKASRIEDSSLEEWKSDFDVNVFSVVAFVGYSQLSALVQTKSQYSLDILGQRKYI